VTLLEKYSDLFDLINEIFKTGNWGVTFVIIKKGEIVGTKCV